MSRCHKAANANDSSAKWLQRTHSESSNNAPLLAQLVNAMQRWPRPEVNPPHAILNCARAHC